jgi:hypothetical protein
MVGGRPADQCPKCGVAVRSFTVLPVAFAELDQAQAEAAYSNLSGKRGRKRTNATIARLNPGVREAVESEERGKTSAILATELRTGRWTPEESSFCDHLTSLFDRGQLPIPDGVKLNEFLSQMLKSRQSRLTKKMKNARLSTKSYSRTTGFVSDDKEAREFSNLETRFFASIRCRMERSEIRFHMQKEWRTYFSELCVQIHFTIDLDSWLHSVEEMERRNAAALEAMRLAKRQVMMGAAFSHDSTQNFEVGVFIEPTHIPDLNAQAKRRPSPDAPISSAVDLLSRSSDSMARHSEDRLLDQDRNFRVDDRASPQTSDPANVGQPNDSFGSLKRYRLGGSSPVSSQQINDEIRQYSSPFLGRAMQYIQRHGFPFEYVDAWVPSFLTGSSSDLLPSSEGSSVTRLCFAGCATAEAVVPPTGGPARLMNQAEIFDLVSFGLYSTKFSFDVGRGLPGRVYSSSSPSWERKIQDAPAAQFERRGGAVQWSINTVVGIPVISPSVGRIVVCFYSRHDRPQNDNVVVRLREELTKVRMSRLLVSKKTRLMNALLFMDWLQLLPSPQWRLVIDIGIVAPAAATSHGDPSK